MFRTKLIKPTVKVLDAEKGIVEAIVSDESEDRDGDVIRQAGWLLDDFHKHPVLLSSHDYGSLQNQIGTWDDMAVSGTKLVGTARYFVGEGNPEADWGFNLASKGAAAYSVGFVPREYEQLKGKGGLEFLKQELLEVSHVTIPSNRNALQLQRSAGQKWPFDDSPYGQHCIVVGCDDAALIAPSICEEHLKYLINAPAEPSVGQPVEESFESLLEKLAKAGTPEQLQSALVALSPIKTIVAPRRAFRSSPLPSAGSLPSIEKAVQAAVALSLQEAS